MEDTKDYPTRDKTLVGAAGVHTVVAELSLRGLIALPTIRNTAGVDVIVSNRTGTWHANLQVKTSRSRVAFWPVGAKYAEWENPNNYYVFLRFHPKIRQFEIFLESSKRVTENCASEVNREKEKGLKKWTPCFYPRNGINKLKAQWDAFGDIHNPVV
ncbi:MAG: hypothetical protein JXA81_13525 [Sedimentisphaerales bacterium]|nr:hypothetical protein [Sedimentisphaerales bacterium]